MMGYTKKQRDLLEFVAKYQRENGVSPTLQEIGEEFGISRVTAFQHVNALEKRGAVTHRAREARCLEWVAWRVTGSVTGSRVGACTAASASRRVWSMIFHERSMATSSFNASGPTGMPA